LRDVLSQYKQTKPQEANKVESKSSHSKPAGDIEDIRNPMFFIRQVGEDGEVGKLE